jgi:hypothetical protein
MKQLRAPAVLAFAVVGATTAALVLSCADSAPKPDAAISCVVYCVYQSVDNGNCPFPTCATGTDHDTCPQGCVPAPVT